VRLALLAVALSILAACASSRSGSRDRGDRVVEVDGCDAHGQARDLGRRPAGDQVRIVTSCDGDRICQPGPKARLRDKLACAGMVDEGAGKLAKTRPGPGALHRRTQSRRGSPRKPTTPIPPAPPPAPQSD